MKCRKNGCEAFVFETCELVGGKITVLCVDHRDAWAVYIRGRGEFDELRRMSILMNSLVSIGSERASELAPKYKEVEEKVRTLSEQWLVIPVDAD